MSKPQEAFALIIFGATGNLAQLKLIPALYDLVEANLLPKQMTIIGVGRKKMTDQEFRDYSHRVLHQPNRHHQHPIVEATAAELLGKMRYLAGDIAKPEIYQQLHGLLDQDRACTNRMFYLATYPELYQTVFEHLQSSDLNSQKCGFARVIIEKPIGNDLASAKQLNQLLAKYYVEDQIFRLDHYLGRETLQNILSFRFANNLLEPLINHEQIDHVQVTAAEDFGIGLRGGYYDSVGALKDVGQNHLLQMIALATMEEPRDFSNQAITASRLKLLQELRPDPDKLVFGQYDGYLREQDVRPDSKSDTFFALRTTIANSRFQDVPIYVRAGKLLKRTVTEVTFVFKTKGQNPPNMLVYRVQPNAGIVMRFSSKIPGPTFKLQNEYLQFCYKNSENGLPDPYLRLLVDALSGDQTFFVDAEEVEAQWQFVDPLVAKRRQIHSYQPGSWGPEAADQLIEADGRKWIEPSVSFCAL